MRTAIQYLLLTVCLALLSSGVVVSAFMDASDRLGYDILWLDLPMTLLFIAAVVIDTRYAVPRFLLRRRYIPYCGFLSVISYAASICALGIEYLTRRSLHIPLRIADYSSIWIGVDTLCNCVLLLLILLGIGAWQLYKVWDLEDMREKELTRRLDDYMRTVKGRLRPEYILGCLDSISVALTRNASEAIAGLQNLSRYLRNQLYELPTPPITEKICAQPADYSALTNFLVSRRFRFIRHLIFQIVLIVIAFGTFFNAPDRPEFSMHRFVSFLTLYFILNLFAYLNILWLFRRFRRHRDFRRYAVETGVLVACLTGPVLIAEIASYDPNVYDKGLPALITVLSTAGTILTIFFYQGGIAGILILQDWINGLRRQTLLHAETARQEYAFLKKQINPHFLFNVINNVSILSYEDITEARQMLGELQRMITYQFAETRNSTTALSDEINFLCSYLRLEGSRIEPFEFEIDAEGDTRDIRIPTLMFITFVENAVKFSSVVNGRRVIKVSFRIEGPDIVFTCSNTFCPKPDHEIHSGGLGLTNTRRRLELLYGDRFGMTRKIEDNLYISTLKIPQ
ncbi:MAG: histidine kinase [Bacteroidales bacterium]|nr:histidine kinase [Bacteroidales bacterium]